MSKPSKLTEVIMRSASALQQSTGRLAVDEVLEYANEHFPEQISAESSSLARQALHRRFKSVLRTRYGKQEKTEEQEQLGLPGVPAPVTISVPDGNRGTVIVPFGKAKWADILASRDIRVQNRGNCDESLQDFEKKMGVLKPFMEGTGRTVEEALQLLKEEQEQTEAAG